MSTLIIDHTVFLFILYLREINLRDRDTVYQITFIRETAQIDALIHVSSAEI